MRFRVLIGLIIFAAVLPHVVISGCQAAVHGALVAGETVLHSVRGSGHG
jgi:hypothetical protein